jgi:hypothetical protein
MMKPLSRVKYHNLRDYWKKEMVDFSFWLSKKENLYLLSKSIGINLELIKREATENSRLRVDILAKDKETNERIIIENQLEETDFSHLGKLLTYATIFNSNTIIWIVKDIKPEHEFTINWFNQNTKDKIRIFLIRIQIVSIENSPFAPLFTIVSKPSNQILPKIKESFGIETLELIEKRDKIEKEVLDERILEFFDKYLTTDIIYTKRKYDKNDKGILDLLKEYNMELFIKYNGKYTREIKRDLHLWANFRQLKVNQKQFEKNGNRDYKSGGKEYFLFSV